MKKCFWKPLALVHKFEHSLTATTFYKKSLFRCHSSSFRCNSGSFRSITVSFRFIPVHSGPFRCHSGSFRSIPPHSGSFRSISVFSNAHWQHVCISRSVKYHPSHYLNVHHWCGVTITCFLDKSHLDVLHSHVYKLQACLRQTFMIPIARYTDNKFKGKVSVRNF